MPSMSRFMALVLGVILLAGCVSMKNTPQQDYIYAMAKPCEGNGVTVERVSPDGQTWGYRWIGGAYTWPEFQKCFAEQLKARPYGEWLQEIGQSASSVRRDGTVR
jgi:hypothetical protein